MNLIGFGLAAFIVLGGLAAFAFLAILAKGMSQ